MEVHDQLLKNFLFKIITQLVPYTENLGVKLLALEEGHISLEMPVRKEVENHVSSAHAGALYTFLETLAGGAVISLINICEVSVLVKEAKIEYFHPGMGLLTGKATMSEEDKSGIKLKLDQEGKVKPEIHPEVYDAKGNLVAKATFTYSLKKMRIG